MTTSELAKEIYAVVFTTRQAKACFSLEWALEYTQNAARKGALPYSVYNSAYGIQWAISSLRVSGACESQINALTPYKLCLLIADAALTCDNIGEVPRYLIGRYHPA